MDNRRFSGTRTLLSFLFFTAVPCVAGYQLDGQFGAFAGFLVGIVVFAAFSASRRKVAVHEEIMSDDDLTAIAISDPPLVYRGRLLVSFNGIRSEIRYIMGGRRTFEKGEFASFWTTLESAAAALKIRYIGVENSLWPQDAMFYPYDEFAVMAMTSSAGNTEILQFFSDVEKIFCIRFSSPEISSFLSGDEHRTFSELIFLVIQKQASNTALPVEK